MAPTSAPPSQAQLLLSLLVAGCAMLAESQQDCRWRFDDCGRASHASRCEVVLRRWCNCSRVAEKAGNAGTAGKAGSSSLVHECADNATVTETVSGASVRLGVSSEGGNAWSPPLSQLCNVTGCHVRPVACQWQPWKSALQMCGFRYELRSRKRCCHPITKLPVNQTCRFRTADVKIVPGGDCYSDLQSSHSKHESSDTPHSSDDKSDDSPSDLGTDAETIIECFIVLLFSFGLGTFCVNMFCRRRLPQQAQPRHTVPEIVYRPEPGHPVATEHLPSHFRNPVAS